ncbi:MAG: ImmA/IrrE family metallo-endopeptidase [Cyanobacteriota bacterium]
MSALYKKLQRKGLQQKYIRETILPSWWSPELNDKPAAVLEGAGYIAQRLNLDLKSLLAEDEEPRFKTLPHPKFKYHKQNQAEPPDIAYQIATKVAEAIAFATNLQFGSLPSNSHEMRSSILSKHSLVNLSSLLDYCWEKGIAVVYFNNYPKNQRKLTGMIQWQGDQPVIVLSSGRTYPACLAFHLAHELGHLVLGHVKQGEGILIDEKIKENSLDQEEIESNQFATDLLVDGFDNCFKFYNIRDNNQLRERIDEIIEKEPTIDPCAIAYNHGWHTGSYDIAQKAVNNIDGSKNGDKIINQFLEQQIEWDDLSENQADYLDQILGE